MGNRFFLSDQNGTKLRITLTDTLPLVQFILFGVKRKAPAVRFARVRKTYLRYIFLSYLFKKLSIEVCFF